jgi:hypothetical protein
MKYRKWSPSGRADGQNIEAFDSLPLMTSCGSPPEADTFEIPEMEPLDVDPAKIMAPRLFHAPPAPPGASHRIRFFEGNLNILSSMRYRFPSFRYFERPKDAP